MLDDEPDFCAYVCSVANAIGFNASSPESTQFFLDNYAPGKELVLVDLYMPGIDGVELLRFMANAEPPKSIILMSGGDESVLRSAQKLAHELGLSVVDIIRKPIRKAELEKVLLRALGVMPSALIDTVSQVTPPTTDLENALVSEDIDVVFQPQRRCSDGALVGVEALARWHHKELGAIPPLVFVASAEAIGVVATLDRIVMRKAVKHLSTFVGVCDNIRLSINMSAHTFSNLELPELVTEDLENVGISPSSLVIEVTETALMQDLRRSLDILTRLRMKGIQLSIDDFGTGYSSMSQLVRIPFSELKIDRSFVEDADSVKDCRAVVKASIMLAHELGMTTVAEGVSSQTLLDLVTELGCDISQGYFTGKPMSAASVLSLLETQVEPSLP